MTELPIIKNAQISNALRSRNAILAVAYIGVWVALGHVAALLSLKSSVSLWYLPAGLTFAILLKWGPRALPLPIVASLLAGLSLWSGPHWPYALLASVIPPLGYLVATQLLRRWMVKHQQKKWNFNDPQRVALFLLAAFLGSLLTTLGSVAVLWHADLLAGGTALPEVALSWWISDLLGVLTLTPLVLVFVMPLLSQFQQGKPLRPPQVLSTPATAWSGWLHTVSSLLIAVVLVWLSLRLWPEQPQPFLVLLLLPVLACVVAQHGLRSAVLTVLLYEMGIVTMVVLFGQATQGLQYQIVMVTVAVSGLLTGALTQARLAHVARFRDLAEVSNDLLWEFDAQGRLCDLSGQFAKSLAWRPGSGQFWRAYLAPNVQDTDFPALEEALQAQQPFHQLMLRLRLPGRAQTVWTLSSGLPVLDEDGELLGYRGATTDMTEQKKVEALLRDYDRKLEAEVVERTKTLAAASQRNWRLANYDSLTTLPNRNLFFEHLRKGLQQSRRQQRLAALLLVDLDGFKQVNDSYGHEAGDELLRQVAIRLRQCVRASDTAARLGGDEFTIILLDLKQPQGAMSVANKIVERLAQPVTLSETTVTVTVTASIGIALYYPEWPYTLDLGMRLLRDADAAMYAAKSAGKNAWRLAEPSSALASPPP